MKIYPYLAIIVQIIYIVICTESSLHASDLSSSQASAARKRHKVIEKAIRLSRKGYKSFKDEPDAAVDEVILYID